MQISRVSDLSVHSVSNAHNLIIGTMSSLFDQDVGCADPNKMRDKRVLELKAKHNFYVMPTFNANNLRMMTKKYKHEYDNDNLTIYSGGGYVAKSKLNNGFNNRRKRISTAGSRRSNAAKSIKNPRRFNEQLDNVSQKSVNQRRALSRGSGRRHREISKSYTPQQFKERRANDEKQEIKKKIMDKIEQMTEEEIDKVSRQLDEISRASELPNVEHVQDFNNQDQDFDHNDEEQKDIVDNLPEPGEYCERKSITELSEYGSRKIRDIKSASSKRSSKTYISSLRKELNKERVERLKLESDIEELKKISHEISSKLAMNHN